MAYNITLRARKVCVAIGRDPHQHPSALLPSVLSQMPDAPLSPPPEARASPPAFRFADPALDDLLAKHPALATLWGSHPGAARKLAKAGRAAPVVEARNALLAASVLACPNLNKAEQQLLAGQSSVLYYGIFGLPCKAKTLKALVTYLPDRFAALKWSKGGKAERRPGGGGAGADDISGLLSSATEAVGDVLLTVTAVVDGLLCAPGSDDRVRSVVQVKNPVRAPDLEGAARKQEGDCLLIYLRTHRDLGAEEGIMVEHFRRGGEEPPLTTAGGVDVDAILAAPGGWGGALTVVSRGGDGEGCDSCEKMLRRTHSESAGRMVLTTWSSDEADRFWEGTVLPRLAAFFRVACALATETGAWAEYEACEDKAAWYDAAVAA